MRKNNSQLLGQAPARPKKNRNVKKHLEEDSNAVLTQEEYARWWPFTRLAPHRFPQPQQHVYPDALI
jgi:hypothetical protein